MLHDRKVVASFRAALDSDVAAWAVLEGIEDHLALDRRSHDEFEGGDGYAFSHQTPELAQLVAGAVGFATSAQARGIAHNFIETAVDIHVLANKPEVRGMVKDGLQAADLSIVSDALARFFKLGRDATRSRLEEFVSLANGYDTRNMTGWVGVWHDLTRRLLQHESDEAAVQQALELAVRLTADDWERVVAV